jgi:hypothetical protein
MLLFASYLNDLCKVGTSIKLQLSVITCINSGIVPGLFLNTLYSSIEKQNNQSKCLESPEAFFEIPQKLEVSNRTIRRSQVFLHEVTLHNEHFLL